MTDPDRCPQCGSTRFTVEPIDVSSGGRVRHMPGLRSCLDCQDGGVNGLIAREREARGLMAGVSEWAAIRRQALRDLHKELGTWQKVADATGQKLPTVHKAAKQPKKGTIP